jgi:hypothetical protein
LGKRVEHFGGTEKFQEVCAFVRRGAERQLRQSGVERRFTMFTFLIAVLVQAAADVVAEVAVEVVGEIIAGGGA